MWRRGVGLLRGYERIRRRFHTLGSDPLTQPSHVKWLYQPREPKQPENKRSPKVLNQVHHFLETTALKQYTTALAALVPLQKEPTIHDSCVGYLHKLMAQDPTLSVGDVKTVLEFSKKHQVAPSSEYLVAMLSCARKNAQPRLRESVTRFARRMASDFHVDVASVDRLLESDCRDEILAIWPEARKLVRAKAPVDDKFEFVRSPGVISAYVDDHGLLSFDQLCQYVKDSKPTAEPTYRVFESLPSDKREQFLHEIETAGIQRQLEIESHCNELAKDFNSRDKITRYTAENKGLLTQWHRLTVTAIRNGEGDAVLQKLRGYVDTVGIETTVAMTISRVIARAMDPPYNTVTTITVDLAGAFIRKLGRNFTHGTLSHQDAIKLMAAVMEVFLRVCKLPKSRIEEFNYGQSLLNVSEVSDDTEQYGFVHRFRLLNGHSVGMIEPHPVMVSQLGDELYHFSLQVRLPMVCQPQLWRSPTSGGFLTNLRSIMPMGTDGDALQMGYLQRAHRSGQLNNTYDVLDTLGSVRWAINPAVLAQFARVMSSGEAWGSIPNANSTTVEACNIRNVYETLLALAQALDGDMLYLPHEVDFRGRAYPLVSVLLNHSEDVGRALLMFWEAKPLGIEGYRWLKYHLAAVYGNDKLTMDQRLDWVKENLESIRASARDPEKNQWWLEGEKRWQTLALCVEIDAVEAWIELGKPESEFRSRIPVHQDGSCNGLQHYAALGGDPEGGKAVNLLPGQRGDVYTTVLNKVKAKVEQDVAKSANIAVETEVENKLSKAVVDPALIHPLLSRKLVKQTIMTTVYGVTQYGGALQISRRIRDLVEPKLVLYEQAVSYGVYLSRYVLASVAELFRLASVIQEWMVANANRLLVSYDPKTSAHLVERHKFQPPVVNPTKFCLYSPMMWTTISGFPVVQLYRKPHPRQIRTALQHIVLQVPHNPEFNRPKSLNAMAPNFIHSLDAIHMGMTAVEMNSRGLAFAAVHDSFWTHACDVPMLSTVLRQQFVNLHSLEVTHHLRKDMEESAEGKLQVVWVEDAVDPEFTKALHKLRLGYDIVSLLKQKLRYQLDVEMNSETICEQVNQLLDQHLPKLWFKQGSNSWVRYDETSSNVRKSLRKATPLLVPVRILPCPPRGTLNIEQVKQSTWFFS